MTWTCPREGCELDINEIYSGFPTKDGGTFDAQDAREVARRVAQRLWGDET